MIEIVLLRVSNISQRFIDDNLQPIKSQCDFYLCLWSISTIDHEDRSDGMAVIDRHETKYVRFRYIIRWAFFGVYLNLQQILH